MSHIEPNGSRHLEVAMTTMTETPTEVTLAVIDNTADFTAHFATRTCSPCVTRAVQLHRLECVEISFLDGQLTIAATDRATHS